jgi:hypothetical protein
MRIQKLTRVSGGQKKIEMNCNMGKNGEIQLSF